MAADPAPAAEPSSAGPARPPAPAGPRDKVRIRFQKGGSLRLLSHHDLLRTFERMLRRAALPFHRTQGFIPRPRLVFALSLPLGVVGLAEVVELELDEPLDPAEVHTRLARQTPPGLEILAVERIHPRRTARVRGLSYALTIPPDRAALAQPRLATVLASPNCWVERTRPPRRRLDLRPFLRDLRLTDRSGITRLEIDLWLTPTGTARPEEVLQLLGLEDIVEQGAVLERTRLELVEDIPQPPGTPA
jgi:radical SAM-linked protein